MFVCVCVCELLLMLVMVNGKLKLQRDSYRGEYEDEILPLYSSSTTKLYTCICVQLEILNYSY